MTRIAHSGEKSGQAARNRMGFTKYWVTASIRDTDAQAIEAAAHLEYDEVAQAVYDHVTERSSSEPMPPSP